MKLSFYLLGYFVAQTKQNLVAYISWSVSLEKYPAFDTFKIGNLGDVKLRAKRVCHTSD